MKHIIKIKDFKLNEKSNKQFETYHTEYMSDLINHISDFLANFEDDDMYFKVDKEEQNGFDVWFVFPNTENRLRHCIFSIIKLDYFYGEVDRYFEFELDKAAKRLNYTNEKTVNIALFIDDIMNDYNKNQNMIAYSDIPNIITDISLSRYDIFSDVKKYNL